MDIEEIMTIELFRYEQADLEDDVKISKSYLASHIKNSKYNSHVFSINWLLYVTLKYFLSIKSYDSSSKRYVHYFWVHEIH